jgi:E3 ubiquitin-protein ligase ZSWIM2
VQTQANTPFMPTKPQAKPSSTSSGSSGGGGSTSRPAEAIAARPVGPEDTCPICLNDLLDPPGAPLTHCSLSCGNSIHVKCLQILMEHQQKAQDPGSLEHIKCPLCRSAFGRVADLREVIAGVDKGRRALRVQAAPEVHYGRRLQPSLSSSSRELLTTRRVDAMQRPTPSPPATGFTCKQCLAMPITGIKHSCLTCREVQLCDPCFLKGAHGWVCWDHVVPFPRSLSSALRPHPPHPHILSRHHLFSHRERKHGKSKPSLRHVFQSLPERVVEELQGRELADGDYDLLLGLDARVEQGALPLPIHRAVTILPLHVINTFPVLQVAHGQAGVQEAGRRLGPEGRCAVCHGPPVPAGILRRIPCGHHFHQPCIGGFSRGCVCAGES